MIGFAEGLIVFCLFWPSSQLPAEAQGEQSVRFLLLNGFRIIKSRKTVPAAEV